MRRQAATVGLEERGGQHRTHHKRRKDLVETDLQVRAEEEALKAREELALLQRRVPRLVAVDLKDVLQNRRGLRGAAHNVAFGCDGLR